jgi:hypothetical protein
MPSEEIKDLDGYTRSTWFWGRKLVEAVCYA